MCDRLEVLLQMLKGTRPFVASIFHDCIMQTRYTLKLKPLSITLTLNLTNTLSAKIVLGTPTSILCTLQTFHLSVQLPSQHLSVLPSANFPVP